ncbi:hypothetical protein SAMN03159453_03879 [Pseudomonas sp. NFIX28]|nr:hypothetical protein SAMN03159453_03879 [Pseudomonas sp. NFIX28]
MLIDGRLITINATQQQSARRQLELPCDYMLVAATGLLVHDTGNACIQIPLPTGYVVGAFENTRGHRCFGVIFLNFIEE